MNEQQRQNEDRMRRAMRTIEKLQQRLEQTERLQRSADEPIAIIGMSCRFPGGANSPEQFWQLLATGTDAIGRVPSDRWNAAEYYHPQPATPGKIVTTDGGFLNAIREFDAQFFGISPKEAATLDPQQRLLLEVSWEAMERAGVVPEDWSGRNIGVFVGISGHDYSRHLMCRPQHDIDAYLATGNSHSIAAGRLSYTFGFTGPSYAVDTACSSSLVALHVACQSLRQGESKAALVGGVNCILAPELSITFSQARMLSPDGRCKTFAAEANGFVRSEGCGVVVLKRLADARAAGDPVIAVLRGSAINQDGRSSGLTAPNGPSQQSVIRDALTLAAVRPEQVFYVEAHGTGTALGDPVELNALAGVFSESRDADDPLYVGSVKTNVGHMEAAAGIGGLIKVILSMQHECLPPHLHFEEPTPHVPWQDIPLRVADRSLHWPTQNRRFAAVSSFGFSGTNASVIVEAALAEVGQTATDASAAKRKARASGAAALMLSAKSEAALRQLALRHAESLEAGADWYDACWTAFSCRARFPKRLVVIATGAAEAAAKLRNAEYWSAPDNEQDDHEPSVETAKRFLAGQPATWPGEPGRRLDIPTYPFQRPVHWVERDSSRSPKGVDRKSHPMLGPRLAVASAHASYFDANAELFNDPVWRGHQVFHRPVLPAVGFLEMMLAACHSSPILRPGVGGEPSDPEGFALSLDDVSFAAPLYVDVPSPIQLVL
ncbi:MAG: beta-ketoacyl synthase N-terminal-like domain-containing protein, partial [Planctomycetota bacterium]